MTGRSSFHDLFRIRHGMDITAMNDPPRAESFRIAGRIRDIVLMGQKDLRNSAHSSNESTRCLR